MWQPREHNAVLQIIGFPCARRWARVIRREHVETSPRRGLQQHASLHKFCLRSSCGLDLEMRFSSFLCEQ